MDHLFFIKEKTKDIDAIVKDLALIVGIPEGGIFLLSSQKQDALETAKRIGYEVGVREPITSRHVTIPDWERIDDGDIAMLEHLINKNEYHGAFVLVAASHFIQRSIEYSLNRFGKKEDSKMLAAAQGAYFDLNSKTYEFLPKK